MRPVVKVTKGAGGATGKFRASLAALSKYQVYVGIPARRAPRPKGAKVNNAELMFIHTNGSPLNHIPPRPVIEPAIGDPDNRKLFLPELEAASKAALAGEALQVKAHLNRAGLIAQNVCRAWFVSPKNGWPPNAPSTVRRKGSARPLIDTEELRKSITYVVSDAG